MGKVKEIYGTDTQHKIIKNLEESIINNSLIYVLKNGFYVSNYHFDCIFFQAVSKSNPDINILYDKNILSFIRQIKYSKITDSSIDFVLFLNGLPIATAELKNPFTGQTYNDAIKQFRERNPQDRLLEFKKGAIVHFAIDPYEIHLTTHIDGEKTIFLPFNKGRNDGKGNPDNPESLRSAYLWEKVWEKDTWLDIIDYFIYLHVIDNPKYLSRKEILIFPRYHQLESVLKLTEATRKNGPGTNYLIQHSTGSGKSNTIAWLAYKLFSLHDQNDKPIFDGIIILSDRIVIVNQLGNIIRRFEQVLGTVELVGSTTDLVDNLENYRKIIISTQQKFPFALEKIGKIKGRKFAIIIDEAHSSQSGEGARKVKEVLITNSENSENNSKIDMDEDLVDKIEKYMEKNGPQKSLSYYAFTATPKKKTVRLFGTKISEEDYKPFHIYSMKQAIEEGFILDVLKNYVTYKQYFSIVQTSTNDKVVDGRKTNREIMKYVDKHYLNISQKVKIIIEHFRINCKQKIGGLAKAMIVASSREKALQYKEEIDIYVKSKEYKGINTLVAFSGTLKDSQGKIQTEQSINNTANEFELRNKFDTDEFNILIVAEKYQTGFDQPLLHTMYIDKKLSGIKVVQTLSRINRTFPNKTDTFIIDFQNKIEDIFDNFKPYYQGTTLVDKTDPLILFKLYDEIINYNIITEEILSRFTEIFLKNRLYQKVDDLGMLYVQMNPIIERFKELSEIDQDKIKYLIIKFVETYAFLTQIIQYNNTNLEKLYFLAKLIIKHDIFKGISTQLPELQGEISLQWYHLEKNFEGSLALESTSTPLTLREEIGKPKPPQILSRLSEIIQLINVRFSDIQINEEDKKLVETWLLSLRNIPDLIELSRSNEFEDFYRIYQSRLQEIMLNSVTKSRYFVSKILTDPELKQKIMIEAAKSYHEWAKVNDIPLISEDTPQHNRLKFREKIYKCQGHIYWIDRYIGKEGIEFFVDSLNYRNVKDIKIITSLYDNHQINEYLKNRFKQLQEEFSKSGISLEMKIATTKESHYRLPHDRFIIGQNIKYNVPSFTTIMNPGLSEINETNNEIPFERYWNDQDSLDIIKDWIKIKDILNKTRKNFKSNCSICGKEIDVPFKPDGIRPVYCITCRPKH